MNKEKCDISVFVLLCFLLAFATGLFFCCVKSGFFIDEITTIGQANSSKGGWIYEVRDEYTNGEMIGHTLTGKEIFDYLSVDDSERFDIVSTYRNLSTDCHPPLYHMLLKVFSSFTSAFSKWPGLILNLIIYMLCNLLLYKICLKLCSDSNISAMTMLIFALSPAALASLTFIRMYILLTLFTLLLLYEVVLLFFGKRPLIFPTILLTILMGMLTQYIYVYAAFFLCLSTLLVLIKRKEFRTAFLFSFFSIAGVGLLIPAFPLIFTQFKLKADNGQTLVSNVVLHDDNEMATYLGSLKEALRIVVSDSLSAFEIAVIIITVILIAFIYLEYRKSSKGEEYSKFVMPNNADTKVILFISGFTSVLTFIVISLTVGYICRRYYYGVQALLYPFLCIIFCVQDYKKEQILKKRTKTHMVSLVLVLVTSVLVLTLNPPPYLFADYSGYEKTLADYSHCPCVYVDSGLRKAADPSSFQFLIYSDDAYITNEACIESVELKKYIENHNNNDKVLIYFFEMEDRETDEIEKITHALGYNNNRLLFRSVSMPCYILE